MPDAQLAQFRLMAAYNRWLDGRLYEVAATLTDEERTRDLGAFFHSLHGTLNHLLLTDRIWLARFSRLGAAAEVFGGARLVHEYDRLDRELCSGFAELRAEREHTDELIESWTAALVAPDLERTMVYANARGVERRHPLWFGMAHFFNHQTHHRGQATTLLSQLGRDPGLTDLLALHDRVRADGG